MPKRLVKRFMPDPEKIRHHKHLKMFGTLLHDRALWHLSRDSIAAAFAVGLFFAWAPVPFQMVLAAGSAIFFHANLPVSVALVWVTNPLTMGPMFYGAYKLGAVVMGNGEQDFAMELSWEWLTTGMSLIWQPFVLGCAILGVVSAILGYVGIKLLWRMMVVRKWQRRHTKK
ncbi:MAG: DUF2062 domain-containing protein [Mariprofundaceae bacterium]